MAGNEKRLIDANALVNAFRPLIEIEWNKKASPVSWSDAYEQFCDDVENAPTVDAVEVVRCKDCKKSQKWKNAFGAKGLKCYLLCADIDPDDYCSFGERKDNDQNN